MAAISITVEDGPVREALRDLSGIAVRRGAARALNRAGVTMRKFAVSSTREIYTVKSSALKTSTIQLDNATAGNLAVGLRVRANRIPLSQFKSVRQTRKGVTVEVRKGRRHLYPGAFVAVVKGPGKEVFWRARAADGSRVPRGPLKLLLGPAVSQLLSPRQVVDKIGRIGLERFRTDFASTIEARRQGRVATNIGGRRR